MIWITANRRLQRWVAGKIPCLEGGSQTALLRSQLEAMKDGGTVVIAAPPNPFAAHLDLTGAPARSPCICRTTKPKSKVIILDAKPKFSKQGLFIGAWQKLCGYGTDKP